MESNGAAKAEYSQFVQNMKARTKAFAVRIVKLCQSLAKDYVCRVIGGQLLRAGTAVGAKLSRRRVRTRKEFTAKIRIVLEEVDESLFWLEILIAAEILTESRLAPLMKEADELVRIFTAAHAKSAKRSASKPTR